MSRGERYAKARAWKPFRKDGGFKEPEIGPRGELWEIAEDLTPIKKIDEKKVLDKDRAKS